MEWNLLSPQVVRLEKATFGPVLRAARERRGISLKDLAIETKLSVELWEALEESDLSRWPKRVYARSFVRDYALRVGLDPDEVVNEFCRLFPEWGDRRAERVFRRKAEILAHDLSWEDLPAPRRRASDRSQGTPGWVDRHLTRILGVAVDTTALLAGGLAGARLGGQGFWVSAGMVAAAYTLIGTGILGRSAGLVAAEWIVRTLKAYPGTRRLVSSRAESL